jgi:single-stranded-DNA-specific exonuclease
MNNNKIIRKQAVLTEALKRSDLHPLLKRIYANRNIQNPDQIDYTLGHLLSFHLLKGIDKAAKIVAHSIIRQESVIVVGDFDADGATSSALVVRALRLFGLNSVEYLVPNRFEYGYGLTPEIVAVAHNKTPDLIITVDNGISSAEGVAAAKKNNIKVVITDHHLPGSVSPDADAIVNPNQHGCSFPSKSLAGVGVAFYLMLAVRAKLRELDWFNENRVEPNMGGLLDLVALGTVADVVPLDENNRVLVEQGLLRIRSGNCCYGIQALLRVAGRDLRNCTSQDFGFFVGPRLNAAGRLDDMSAGIECLLADDMESANEHAILLDDLNRQRKDIEGDMLQQATKALDEQLKTMQGQPLKAGLSMYNPAWHQGVVGLLASRIKERFHRPVVAFADANDDGDHNSEIKGSARSIPGLHIRDVLDAITKKHTNLIPKFGGHAMAAGLSLKKSDFETFSRAFIDEVEICLTEKDLEKIIETDGGILADEMTLDSAEILRFASPWGQQFPQPIFDDEFDVLDWRIVGEKHLKFQLQHKTSGCSIDAIAFNKNSDDLPDGGRSIRAVYRMDVNEFRGKRNLQLIVEHIEAA